MSRTGVGDKCDSDTDQDGIFDNVDNCPLVDNPMQVDRNGNKIGDECEEDYDGDGVTDSEDACPKNNHLGM